MNRTDKNQRERGRALKLMGLTRYFKQDLGERLAETKRIFGRRAYAVDIHSHSNFSDGRGTVEENYEAFTHTGLDFLFATDHGSLGQKRMVRKWSNVSWGQEPGGGPHHIGLLMGERLFKPKRDNIAADFERAKKIAPFVWIPHPVGWYPQKWYSDEEIAALWTLGGEFAVEVLNGAGKLVRAYDAFDRKAVEVWDRLLCDGRRVTAIGGSDAHSPDQLGSCWTGILAKSRAPRSLVRALQAGNCFASEAPMLELTCNGRPMGSVVTKKKGAPVRLRFRAADAAGLASVRIVSGGRIVKEYHAGRKTLLKGELICKAGARKTYYRLESTAVDDRRAFSTPVYVE